MNHSLLHLTAVFMLFSVESYCDEQRVSPTTIDKIVQETLAQNPELKFYEAEIAVAQANHQASKKSRNPEFDVEVGRKQTSGDDFSAEGLSYAVEIVQPFEWPGRIGLRKSIANGEVELARIGLEQFKAKLIARVRTLAYRLSALENTASIANDVASRFTGVKEALVLREVGGITPLLEIRAIDAASIIMEKEALEAGVAVQKAMLELNQLMGRRADAPLIVIPEEYEFVELPEIDELLALAYSNSFEMIIHRSELAQQGLRVSLAKNERYPGIKTGPYYSSEDAGEQESEVGIALSIELPIFRSGKAAVEREKVRSVQANASLHAQTRRLERAVAETVLVYNNSRSRLERWSVERMNSIRDAASLADRHYRLGAVPVSVYIELQETYLDSARAVNEVKFETLEAALEIERFTGVTRSQIEPNPQSK